MSCTMALFLHILLLTSLLAGAALGLNNLLTAVTAIAAFEDEEHQALACGKRAAVAANLAEAEAWILSHDSLPREVLSARRIEILQSLDIAVSWRDEIERCNARDGSKFQVQLHRQNERNASLMVPNWVPQLSWIGGI